MSTPDGGPAFPAPGTMNREYEIKYDGMTLRDYFAAKALNAMGYTLGIYGAEAVTMDAVAKSAYRAADAMLAAREPAKPKEGERTLESELLQAAEGLLSACLHHRIRTGTMEFAEGVIAKARAAGVQR